MKIAAGILFVLIAALPYLFMMSSSTKTYEPIKAARSLKIASPHRREVRLEYTRGFNDWLKKSGKEPIGIEWLDAGGSSKILKDLETRFATSPDNPGVDIMFGGGIDPFMKAARQGWLEQIDLRPEVTNGIPTTCAGSLTMDPDRKWFGVALSGFGIVYNAPIVKRLGLPAPADWSDLGRPEYYSWVASGDPRSSGSVHACYEIVLQAYGFEKGWSLITRISANVRNFGESGGTAPREVAAAEIAAGMVIDQYAQAVINAVGDDMLVFVLPAKTTSITPDSIGIIKGTRNSELSRMFLEYALSTDGQRILFQPEGVNGQITTLYRMPILKEMFNDPAAPKPSPYTFDQGLQYDNVKTSHRYGTLNDLMGVWLIDTHQDLRTAWKAVIARGCRDEDVGRLCAPPLSEEELTKLAAAWSDQRQRKDIMNSWAREAQKRYKTLAQGHAE